MSDDPISRMLAEQERAEKERTEREAREPARVVPIRPITGYAEPPPAPPQPAGPKVFTHSSQGLQTQVAIYEASDPSARRGPESSQAAHRPPPHAVGAPAAHGGTTVRMYPAGAGPSPDAQHGAPAGVGSAPYVPEEVLPQPGSIEALRLLRDRLVSGLPMCRQLIASPGHRGTGMQRARDLEGLWAVLYGRDCEEEPGGAQLLGELGHLHRILERTLAGSL